MASFEELVQEIEKACKGFERARARELVTQLVREIRQKRVAFPADLALAALKPLRKKRYFDQMLVLADAVFESGTADLRVDVQYTQALIDSGDLAAALAFVQSRIPLAKAGSDESNELRGLVGRIYKQLYVNGGGSDTLRGEYATRAVGAYYELYRDDPTLTWQGINAAALNARSSRDIAAKILDQMRTALESGTANIGTRVTAGEAALVLGDLDAAKRWYFSFASDPASDAFEIASALRQLIEVWQLKESVPPGSDLLPMLRAELLNREGSTIEFSPEKVTVAQEKQLATRLESTFGPEGARQFGWYRMGLDRCLPVCRIGTKYDDPRGTGFIVRGKDFHDKLTDQHLVLTNNHVVSETFPNALRAPEAFLRFHALEDGVRYAVKDIVWSSPVLDAALLRVDPAPPAANVEVFPIAAAQPDRDCTPKPRVFVIGHPGGGTLAISLYDNHFVDCNDTVIHYRSPTQGGSSGSPVFDNNWDLIALHHAGNAQKLQDVAGTYEANEGIWIQRIMKACAGADVS